MGPLSCAQLCWESEALAHNVKYLMLGEIPLGLNIYF